MKVLIDWLNDFNSMSVCLGLFYAGFILVLLKGMDSYW